MGSVKRPTSGDRPGLLDFMKEWLVGQDALSIEKNYAYMIRMRRSGMHMDQNRPSAGSTWRCGTLPVNLQ